jgi:transposase
MRQRPRLRPIEQEEIGHLYRTGNFTQKSLAEKYGVSRPTILKIIKRYRGSDYSRPKIPREKLERYLLDNPNATYQEMADAFSSSIGSIQRFLYSYKIKLRDIPERTQHITYHKSALENYFAAHPDSTGRAAAKFFKGRDDTFYKAMKRYGLKIPRTQRNKNTP